MLFKMWMKKNTKGSTSECVAFFSPLEKEKEAGKETEVWGLQLQLGNREKQPREKQNLPNHFHLQTFWDERIENRRMSYDSSASTKSVRKRDSYFPATDT